MKPKIAIVRGPGLSKWEMQIYEPLIGWYNIVGIGTTRPVNDIRNIKFPVKQLVCPSQYISFLPKYIPFMFKTFGDTQWLYGFDQAVTDCDLIHSVELGNAFTYQAIQAKKKGLVKAVTLTVYENIPFLLDEFSARKNIKKEVMVYADHFLAANKKALEALLVEGVSLDKISLIPQSVDTQIFHPRTEADKSIQRKFRKRFSIGQNDFVVLGAARLVWEKGWFEVIRAAAKIRQLCKEKNIKQKTVKFLLVGNGGERKNLEDFIKRENLFDSVYITGAIDYQDMPDIFRLADVFVHASIPIRTWNEQFGGVLIEAMATGLPIVGTLNGGIRETVGDEGGIFIQPQDYSEMAYAIWRYFTDSALVQHLGKHNREVAVKQYDMHIVARSIKKIWERIIR